MPTARMQAWMWVAVLGAACPGATPSEPATPDATDAAPSFDVLDAASDPGPDGATPTCPPPPVPAGAVRARTLECEAELPTGHMAAAMVGDIVLENSVARFVLRNRPEGHAYLGLTGGHLVDAVLLGPDGQQLGQDGLRELAVTVEFHLVIPETVRIEDDGSSGAARVSVTGGLALLPMLGDVFPMSMPKVSVTNEYTLRPDRGVIEITTRVVEGAEAPAVTIADVAFWRGYSTLFLPGLGTGNLPILGEVEVVGVTRRVPEADLPGYALSSPGKRQLINAEGILGFVWGPGVVPEGPEGLVHTRHLVVAPELDEALATAWGLSGRKLGLVEGTVSGVAPGVAVELRDGDGGPLTRCSPDPDDGSFSCAAPLEAVEAAATWFGDGAGGDSPDVPGGSVGTPLEVTAGEVTIVDLDAPELAHLDVAVSDPDGDPLPFRLILSGQAAGEGFTQTSVDSDGAATLRAFPGEHQVWVFHGPEYTHFQGTVTLTAGQTQSLEVTLRRVVDTVGWAACDFHVHSEQSPDSDLDNTRRIVYALAEGLDGFVATDHEFVTDHSPWLASAGATGRVELEAGAEVSTIDFGHFNVWPLPVLLGASGAGTPPWAGLDLLGLFALLHGDAEERIVQCNHPRFDAMSLFDKIDFDPLETPLDLLQCDTIELLNGIAIDDTPQVLADWMGLLARGVFIPITGGGDSHGEYDLMGNPRTLVWLGEDAGGPLDVPGRFRMSDVTEALREGRAVATAGPALDLMLSDTEARQAAVGETLIGGGGEVTVTATLQAPDWMALGTVQLIADGEVVLEQDVSGLVVDDDKKVVDVVHAVPQPDIDGWWIAVHVPGEESRPGLRRDPWAVTNPVFVDADGDGSWLPQ